VGRKRNNVDRIDPGVESDVEVPGGPCEDDVDDNSGLIDEDLKRWIAEKNAENKEFVVYLYKFDNPVTGRLKSLIDQYENEIPDQHTIGLTHGGGRYYMLIAVHEGGKRTLTNTRWVRIHKRYDELRIKNQVAALPAPVPVPANNMDGMEYAFKMFQAVIGTLTPLLSRQLPAVDPMQQAFTAYNLTKNVLKDSLMDTQNLYKEMAKKQIGIDDGGGADAPFFDEGREPEKSLLEKLIPLAEAFLPLLLKNDLQAKAASATIRALPQFKEVVNSPQLQKIIEYVDKKEGVKNADIILRNLGIKRPGLSVKNINKR